MKNKTEKLKKFIIKHDNLFFVLLFLIIITGYALNINTSVTDELWNFQNVYKIYNGYKIYVDANVITTPLFHYIGVLIFKIFGVNFLSFRIYNIIIWIFLMLGIYQIYKNNNVRKIFALLFSLINMYVLIPTLIGSSNYNVLALVFVLYGILVIFNKSKMKPNTYIILEALIIVLIVLTKQNIGFYYILGYIIYSICYKEKVKNILKIFVIDIIMAILFILFLKYRGCLYGFINYAILGLNEFGTKNIAASLEPTIFLVFMMVVNVILIYFINKRNIKIINKNNCNIIFCFAMPLTFIAYPIFNYNHIILALILHIILFLSIFYNFFVEINLKEKYWKIIVAFFMLLLITISIGKTIIYFNKINKEKINYNNIYFGTLLSENQKNKIEKVTDFIKNSNEKVVDISPDAALYMMPLKRSNGSYDLLLKGNLGKDGEEGIIKEIKNNKNIIYLINDNEFLFQESPKIKEYIKNNFKNTGKIEDLEIYQSKGIVNSIDSNN